MKKKKHNPLPKDTSSKHTDCNCRCVRCQLGEAAYQQVINKNMAEYGWYVHFVQDDPQTAMGYNYHTHGLTETYGHPDLQITLPIPAEIAHALFINAIEMLKKGVVFFADDSTKYEGIMSGYAVKFVKRREDTRDVYRMICPDQNHQYFGGIYTKQYL